MITLTVNGLDLSGKLSTYRTVKRVTYTDVLTALDGTEYPFPGATKTEIVFSLLPMTDDESAALYNALSGLVFEATYTDQHTDTDRTANVRVTSNIESAFLLLSVDGKRRYKGSAITLRVL